MSIGVASGVAFRDALSCGSSGAHIGGPILLTGPTLLAPPTSAYLSGTTTVEAQVATALGVIGLRECGQGQDRTVDLPLFRRALIPTELPGRAVKLTC